MSGCHECGNGAIEGPEDCDGSDLGGATCESIGTAGGTLACAQDCSFDRTGCFECGNGQCEVSQGETLETCPQDCGWAEIAAGENRTCGLVRGVGVFCWGESIGTTPVAVPNSAGIHAIAAVRQEFVGLDADGCVWRWLSAYEPWLFNDTVVAVALAGGYQEGYCVIDDTGQAWCAGDNQHGQLGVGTFDFVNDLAQVSGMTDVMSIDTSGKHACAVASDGTVWCWGENLFGQLGSATAHEVCHYSPYDVDSDCSSVPVQVVGIDNAVAVSVGGGFSCTLLADSTVRCWGGRFGWTARRCHDRARLHHRPGAVSLALLTRSGAGGQPH